MSQRSVTIAIPAFNAGRTIGAVLEGVRRGHPADELLVVDDGSQDDTVAVAGRAGARIVAHGANLGLARARNTALAAAHGELVVFFDADAVPAPDALSRLCRGHDDPCVGGVSGQVIEPIGTSAPDRWRALFWRQTQGEQRLESAAFLVGACFSLRRQAALDVGGFLPRLRTNGEDVELSLRLRAAGWRLVYDPRAQVAHLRRDDLPSLLRMIYRHRRDQLRALRLHDAPSGAALLGALRWGPVTLVSSLRRHRSLALAALCPLCYGAALAGCGAGLLLPSRPLRLVP